MYCPDKFDTRKLINEVRHLTLKEIKEILLDTTHKKVEKAFRQALLIKLASNVLPRVNEIAGEGGEPLQMVIKRAYVNEKLEPNIDLEIGTTVNNTIKQLTE